VEEKARSMNSFISTRFHDNFTVCLFYWLNWGSVTDHVKFIVVGKKTRLSWEKKLLETPTLEESSLSFSPQLFQ